ncbi:MAG: glutamate--tRNA ligase [Gammaproteobacteria bacterium]|nr:glutamate--tRNA ligase [Gammaproteobacteria bacterium]
MTSRPFKTRFAPSPTGLLHLGNIRTALFNYLLARQAQGTFLLRLEDTDAMRGHEKYARALEQDLRWLGLAWNEGPEAGGRHGPYAQSERGSIYKEYFNALESRGLVYPCFCSEHELAIARKTALAAHRPPRYSGKCRALSPQEVQARFARGEPATLRFRVEEGKTVEFEDKVRGRQVFSTDDIGDYVIRRSDGTPAFFFCNAIDDALMEVALVVRGEDHLTNTPRQILLLKALGLPLPEYAHIALVVGADGAPLSKRTGSKSVEELRSVGYLPSAINNYLARLGHTYDANAFMNLEILAENFDLSRLGRAPARYDEAQLMHWQREAILHLPSAALREWMGDAVQALVPRDKREAFIEAIRGNVSFPNEAEEWAKILFGTETIQITGEAKDLLETAQHDIFQKFLKAMEQIQWNAHKFGKEFPVDLAPKSSFPLVRVALTNRLKGPEMWRLFDLLGEHCVRARLGTAEPMLGSAFKKNNRSP